MKVILSSSENSEHKKVILCKQGNQYILNLIDKEEGITISSSEDARKAVRDYFNLCNKNKVGSGIRYVDGWGPITIHRYIEQLK